MRALLGVDALYRDESGDDAGLAVLNLDTAGRYRPEPWPGYDAAADAGTALRADATAVSLYCPECKQTWADDALRVCPSDGTRLYRMHPEDDPLLGFTPVPHVAPRSNSITADGIDHRRRYLFDGEFERGIAVDRKREFATGGVD